jgi:hypothetical protein
MRTVRDALCHGKWLEDIQGEISVEALMEFLELWDVLSDVELQEGIHDKHVWRLSGSGEYTAKSAYEAIFQGTIFSDPMKEFGSHGPPKMSLLHVAGRSRPMLDS